MAIVVHCIGKSETNTNRMVCFYIGGLAGFMRCNETITHECMNATLMWKENIESIGLQLVYTTNTHTHTHATDTIKMKIKIEAQKNA